jgi:hypothetical protein
MDRVTIATSTAINKQTVEERDAAETAPASITPGSAMAQGPLGARPAQGNTPSSTEDARNIPVASIEAILSQEAGRTWARMESVASIELGQTYTYPADRTDGLVNPGGPENAITFVNKAQKAAAVIYKKVQGKFSPIYISKDSPLEPGTETLIPVAKVCVWFSADAETGSMISSYSTNPLVVDMTASKKATCSYDGNWTRIPNAPDAKA